jgi:hypothetical protein
LCYVSAFNNGGNVTDASPLLAPWSNFYVIVGSSAGALTGLQFVVIALVAEAEAIGGRTEIRAFASPTIVHFCVALVISAIANAPWQSIAAAGVTLAAFGAAGVAYSLTVIRHARSQMHYVPDAEDWFWYTALPLLTYAILLAAGAAARWHPRPALFMVAAISLVLLFIGIHNAWDTVTYVALKKRETSKAHDQSQDAAGNT